MKSYGDELSMRVKNSGISSSFLNGKCLLVFSYGNIGGNMVKENSMLLYYTTSDLVIKDLIKQKFLLNVVLI